MICVGENRVERFVAGWFAGDCRGDECEASIYSKHIQKGLTLLDHINIIMWLMVMIGVIDTTVSVA